ncbi:DoxX family protein [Ramlibacter sp. G-1-2-2]|uniref:DoxX family protein n=1 Tax=Ramlibacter agri TaxID=2728837 RepID=A0A848GY69_9BURK|nr:DoxX family protein [Ramlibacter agri]NML43284.1 DoxX family protein [Ramlibacter agri]
MSWTQRIGVGLSALATLFFVADAIGKLVQAGPVLQSTQELGWPATAVIPLGVLLLVGALLYAIPNTAFVGAIYLTAFLGGAVATHYRIGSPLGTHVLFGVYVALIMWGGLALRYPAVFVAALRPGNA